MKKPLSLRFKKIRRCLAVRSAFKNGLHNHLLARFFARQGVSPKWYHRHRFQRAAVLLAAFLVVLSSGVTAYAYTSVHVTDGSALYPIKQTLENVEEKMQWSPERKATFYLKILDRRSSELTMLQNKNRLDQVDSVRASIQRIIIKLAGVQSQLDGREHGQLKQRIQRKLETLEHTID